MDVLTAVKVLFRRWYIVLTVLVLSGIVTAVVVGSTPASYRSSGSLVVASPGGGTIAPGVPSAQNPFSNLDYSASLVANIVSGLMQERPARDKLLAAGAQPDYVIGTPGGTSTPLISIEATAATPEDAMKTVNLVLAATQDQLIATQRDAGAPPETWVRSYLLSKPVAADRLVGGKVRALVALTALGLAAATSTAFIAENIAVRRRGDGPDDEADEPEDERKSRRPPHLLPGPPPITTKTTQQARVPSSVPPPDLEVVVPDVEPVALRPDGVRPVPIRRPEIAPVSTEPPTSRGSQAVAPGRDRAGERVELPVFTRRHPSVANRPQKERIPATGTDDEPPTR